MQCEIVRYMPDSTLAAAIQIGANVRCKFVVIAQPDRLSLVWGPLSLFAYHANLVDRFCSDRLIASHWVKRPDVVAVVDRCVTVKGGGLIEIAPSSRTATIGGASKAYGYFAVEDIRQLTVAQPILDGYRLVFA
jgi:hypothetical protein